MPSPLDVVDLTIEPSEGSEDFEVYGYYPFVVPPKRLRQSSLSFPSSPRASPRDLSPPRSKSRRLASLPPELEGDSSEFPNPDLIDPDARASRPRRRRQILEDESPPVDFDHLSDQQESSDPDSSQAKEFEADYHPSPPPSPRSSPPRPLWSPRIPLALDAFLALHSGMPPHLMKHWVLFVKHQCPRFGEHVPHWKDLLDTYT